MSLTKQEIRERVGYRLALTPVGQALQDQAKVRIDQAYIEVHADLTNDALATWGIDDEVPDELVRHVVALAAWTCTDTYGISGERYARLAADTANAKPEIRRLIQPYHTSEVENEDY